MLSFLLILTRQLQSQVLKGALYILDFCSALHTSTRFPNTGPGCFGVTEGRVAILSLGMERNPGVNHLTKHLLAYL